MPTQLGLGSGLGSSRMSLECKTERVLGLAQDGEPAQLCSSPMLARSAAQLIEPVSMGKYGYERLS